MAGLTHATQIRVGKAEEYVRRAMPAQNALVVAGLKMLDAQPALKTAVISIVLAPLAVPNVAQMVTQKRTMTVRQSTKSIHLRS